MTDSHRDLTLRFAAIRRRRPDRTDSGPDRRQPALAVHVDQTPSAVENRVKRHLPAEDVPTLLANRYQIINLWRPINHAADDHPLALCDFRSVDFENDLVTVKLRYTNYEGETFGVKFNEKHRWKYLKGMQPDEGVLLKWCVATQCSSSDRDK